LPFENLLADAPIEQDQFPVNGETALSLAVRMVAFNSASHAT
jgi:hypothetical protein